MTKETVSQSNAMTALVIMDVLHEETTTRLKAGKSEEVKLVNYFHAHGEKHGEGIFGVYDRTLSIHAPLLDEIWDELDDDGIVFDMELVPWYLQALVQWDLDYFEPPPEAFRPLFVKWVRDHQHWNDAASYWRTPALRLNTEEMRPDRELRLPLRVWKLAEAAIKATGSHTPDDILADIEETLTHSTRLGEAITGHQESLLRGFLVHLQEKGLSCDSRTFRHTFLMYCDGSKVMALKPVSE